MNFCNKRKFPDHFYDVYKLSKHDRGKYLNTWFKGDYFVAKKDKGIIYTDDWWTFKQVDKDTSWRLYNEEFNPILLGIDICSIGKGKFKLNEAGEKLYNMLAIIHSIDDCSYGSWFLDIPYKVLLEKRLELAQWIDQIKIINGNAFWDKCETMGATEKTYD